jgi:hypothetical protein
VNGPHRVEKRVNTPFGIGLAKPIYVSYSKEQQKDSGNSIKCGRFHRFGSGNQGIGLVIADVAQIVALCGLARHACLSA